jgi:hypothetical protein
MSEIDIVGLAVDGLKRSIAADEAADTIATLADERDEARHELRMMIANRNLHFERAATLTAERDEAKRTAEQTHRVMVGWRARAARLEEA